MNSHPDFARMKTVKDHWESYKNCLLDPSIPPELLTEIMMCYYAGARALFSLIVNNGPWPGVDQQSLDQLNVWKRELDLFLGEVKRERNDTDSISN